MCRKDVSRPPVGGMTMDVKMREAPPCCPSKVSPTHSQTYYFVRQDSQRLKGINIIKIFNLRFGKYKLFLSLHGIYIVCLYIRLHLNQQNEEAGIITKQCITKKMFFFNC